MPKLASMSSIVSEFIKAWITNFKDHKLRSYGWFSFLYDKQESGRFKRNAVKKMIVYGLRISKGQSLFNIKDIFSISFSNL